MHAPCTGSLWVYSTSDRLGGMSSMATSLAFAEGRCCTAWDLCFFTLSGALLMPLMRSFLLLGLASLPFVPNE